MVQHGYLTYLLGFFQIITLIVAEKPTENRTYVTKASFMKELFIIELDFLSGSWPDLRVAVNF